MAIYNSSKKYFVAFFPVLVSFLIFSCDDSGKNNDPASRYITVDYRGAALEYLTWDMWEMKEYSEYYMGSEGNNDPEIEPVFENPHWELADQYTGYGPETQVREVMVIKNQTIKYFYQLDEPDFRYCSKDDESFTVDANNYYISEDTIRYIVKNGDLVEYDFYYNYDEVRWEMTLWIYKQLDSFTERAMNICF